MPKPNSEQSIRHVKPQVRQFNDRRVNFKQCSVEPRVPQFNHNGRRNLNLAIRSTLDDSTDIDDFSNNVNVRNGTGNRRRTPYFPRTHHDSRGTRKLIAGTSGWFQVIVSILLLNSEL